MRVDLSYFSLSILFYSLHSSSLSKKDPNTEKLTVELIPVTTIVDFRIGMAIYAYIF